MRSLEQESRRRMLSYEAIVYPEKETETGRGLARVDAAGGADIILGHVVWAFGLAGFPRIIAKLGRLDAPVAVVDEYGDVAPETIHAAGGKTRTYRIGSSQSAPRRVARLLLQNGHRHVAYISPIHTYPWTRMRFRVLNDTFTAAHRRNTVSLFTSDSSRQTELLYSQFHVLHRAPELIAFLNRFSSSYLALSDAEAFRRLEHEITAILNRIERLPHVNDFFDGILRDERITAWIASNDLDALLALNYLRGKKVDIPGELSLVSFDDASEAYSYNFSSYNFNVPAVVQGVLDYFLAPAATSGRERVIEAPGMIVERGTTGPAPMCR